MKVLLGIEGGENSIGVLRRTVERAQRAGDDLTVAILEDEGADQSADAFESDVRSTLAEADCEADIRRLEENGGSELVRTAERDGFDRIVLGDGKQTPMEKIRLSHLAEYVLLNSPVTVTLVR
ncbi:universal stress protein [Halanaeroarchaeum sulfurireducens]|uniref:UspA domain-containing protein n=1 Tax=Halanaeroarchaeum sulfurireducens TaxID=1604004 RepID=A0A0F7PBQ2_9EURY|nr:universal stress protein [Halanaeroarchaeum sulfurireducens]AKH96768.1 UspA domain-containing protein [Halanaeroarchaeum sulfurireducens]ALG81170.1 UspA domain-containing protein [Halanaeroarchaeum sulfurireducens]